MGSLFTDSSVYYAQAHAGLERYLGQLQTVAHSVGASARAGNAWSAVLDGHLLTVPHHPWQGSYIQAAVGAVLLLLFLSVIVKARTQIYLLARFAWSCFLAPIGGGHGAPQKARLDAFYRSQASIYDATRSRLLKGREDMLHLTASHLQEQINRGAWQHKKLVWVDVGGGTGSNIEQMAEYMELSQFHAIFLIDLCEPLLEVARKRFAARGWKNVHCISQDATSFVLPDVGDGVPITDISLCTMSYSLSMVPNFYGMLDRIEHFLDPKDGIVACVDFYVSGRSSQTQMVANAGDIRRLCNWWNRTFWLHWFEWDHVDLHPSRRNYLEWRFGTIKSVNSRNNFGPFASIPYYIWMGCKAQRDLASRLSAFGADPLTPIMSPSLSALTSLDAIPDLSLTPSLQAFSPPSPTSPPRNGGYFTRNGGGDNRAVIDRSGSKTSSPKQTILSIPPESTGSPLSSFYYQKHNYRMPYFHGDDQKQFWSWIYAFTWEDPKDDMKRMKITSKDTVMCITSAGDNALHYAVEGKPKRIHCVDMNPCQGHLLELKLAAINALQYEDFWQLFGEGRHPDFRKLLDEKLAPHLSAHAYAFWRAKASTFDKCFYLKGYSGLALRLLSAGFTMAGKAGKLEEFANADTLETQRQIYEKSIRPVLVSGTFVTMLASNPAVLWNALGVPKNQLACLTKETSVKQYLIDTLDPIGRTLHLRTEGHHYYLTLMAKYLPENSPLYLTRAGFAQLKADKCARLDAFRLHTDTLKNVTKSIEAGSLDVAIFMDSQDWFSPTDLKQIDDLQTMIRAVRRAMPVGGRAYWRSAGMHPWYADLWATEGFRTERLSVRKVGTDKPIDEVNMYASLWRAIRV